MMLQFPDLLEVVDRDSILGIFMNDPDENPGREHRQPLRGFSSRSAPNSW